jgi:hypothetical protein
LLFGEEVRNLETVEALYAEATQVEGEKEGKGVRKKEGSSTVIFNASVSINPSCNLVPRPCNTDSRLTPEEEGEEEEEEEIGVTESKVKMEEAKSSSVVLRLNRKSSC